MTLVKPIGGKPLTPQQADTPEHSPLPWEERDGVIFPTNQDEESTFAICAVHKHGKEQPKDKRQIARRFLDDRDKANAAYIAKACNAYPHAEVLAEALKCYLDATDYTAGNCRVNEPIGAVLEGVIIRKAREALAQWARSKQ
jgi:hypothetical protein